MPPKLIIKNKLASKGSSGAADVSSKLAKTYQKKTDREHILDAPDTYIGSIEPDEVKDWTWNATTESMENRTYTWIPGLYKCFDEAVVNARDHYIRMKSMNSNDANPVKKAPKYYPVKNIDITIDPTTGVISIMNDGNGIDVVKHPEHNIWIPEMIFGHLRTSTNYNKDEKRIVGGKNGFGVKLVLIYAKWGTIETVDHTRNLKYIQSFKDNLSVIEPPTITSCRNKPYLRITWLPDYARFGMSPATISDDMLSLLTKRSYDISAVTDKDVKVTFNKKVIPTKTFEQYVDLYVGSKKDTKRIFERYNDRWEYAVCLSPQDEFTQVSFVNGIYTAKGGKHVDYILNQICRGVAAYIETKKKVKVKTATIKEQLMLFVNCVVENPSFDSQTKDFMNTAVAKFGSTCKVSDKFIEKIAKMGVMDQAMSIHQVRETNTVARKTDGKKTRMVRGIPKLVDANWAGTAKSGECTLILCEGDSAKAGIVSGLAKEDRNHMGIYPLKGKLRNVRGVRSADLSKNTEINDIKKILGLETGKKYLTPDEMKKSLRYGKVMILTDADVDGHHIKGLTINLFHSHWKELSYLNDFLCFMNTPILKARKGAGKNAQELLFYNQEQYEQWKEGLGASGTKGWSIKYYKGLGTSTSKEFKEYFKNRKIVNFARQSEDCDDSIDLAFNSKRADDRKEWLGNYNKEAVLNTDDTEVSYREFIHKELIHFSKYDNERSIPNMVDGLKTSLRKILYSCFKRKLTNEIKVAQLGGYVSEHSGYHHGEQSLMKAIVGMANNFVGSNNINVLVPAGQFGTRLQGGEDAASERYIFTYLTAITRKIFPEADDQVLTYLEDDGTPVEPEFYVPIIPMLLVNGSKGIGTGFSTDVMAYNPTDLIQYLKMRMSGTSPSEAKRAVPIHPYYEGFRGQIQPLNDNCTKYVIRGVYDVVGKDTIRITELPIGLWTDKFKEILEKLMDTESKATKTSKKNASKSELENASVSSSSTTSTNTAKVVQKKSAKKPIVKEYTDMSTDTTVDFTIVLSPGVLDQYRKLTYNLTDGMPSDTIEDVIVDEIEKTFKLISTRSTDNMNAFDEKQRLRPYKSVYDIIENYMEVRMDMYTKRKIAQLNQLEKECILLSNKARFIEKQCNDEIDLRRKNKSQVVALLAENGFDTLDGDEEYGYLRRMPIDSVLEENILKMRNDRDAKMKEYDTLKKKTEKQIWMDELDELLDAYGKYRKERDAMLAGVEQDDGSHGEKKRRVMKKKPVGKRQNKVLKE